jgi:predicted secreted Zn-dependent protease
MNNHLRQLTLAAGVLTCAAAAHAEVQSEVEYRSYNAYAERGKSLYQVLAAATPFHGNSRPFIGNTSRDIHWRLHWRDNGRGICRIDDVRVALHATITLPQLSGIDADRQPEYTRFYAALRNHENGHYRIEQEMAAEIDRALASLPEAACNAIEGIANARGNDLTRIYNSREVQYDAETDHGRTQGAVLRN